MIKVLANIMRLTSTRELHARANVERLGTFLRRLTAKVQDSTATSEHLHVAEIANYGEEVIPERGTFFPLSFAGRRSLDYDEE